MLQTTTTAVYIEFEELPDACRPCWLVRVDGAVLLTVDPRSSKFECTRYAVDNLTAEEAGVMRRAFGAVGENEPGPPSWTSDEPVVTDIPPELRLPLPAVLNATEMTRQRRPV